MNQRMRFWPFAYVVVAIVAALACVLISLDPSSYATRRGGPDPWAHPTADVFTATIATLLEGLVVALAFNATRGQRLWPTALLMLCLYGPWLLISLATSFHAPGFRLVHSLWLFALTSSLAAIAVGSRLRQMFRTHDAAATQLAKEGVPS